MLSWSTESTCFSKPGFTDAVHLTGLGLLVVHGPGVHILIQEYVLRYNYYIPTHNIFEISKSIFLRILNIDFLFQISECTHFHHHSPIEGDKWLAHVSQTRSSV